MVLIAKEVSLRIAFLCFLYIYQEDRPPVRFILSNLGLGHAVNEVPLTNNEDKTPARSHTLILFLRIYFRQNYAKALIKAYEKIKGCDFVKRKIYYSQREMLFWCVLEA